MEGPDHMLSSDPKELTELIKFKKNYKKFNSWFFKKGKKEKDEINLIVGMVLKKYNQMNTLQLILRKKVCMQKKISKKMRNLQNLILL